MKAIVRSSVALLLLASAVPPATAAAVRRDVQGIALGATIAQLQARFDNGCVLDPEAATPNTYGCGPKVAQYFSQFEIGTTGDGLADRIKYTFCSTQKFPDVAQNVVAAYAAVNPQIDDFNMTVDLDPATKLELRLYGTCAEDGSRRFSLILVGRDLVDADLTKQRSEQSQSNQTPKF